ncbi:hypothetical protein C8R43DRAFT_1054843, partial [Mycena crocata]
MSLWNFTIEDTSPTFSYRPYITCYLDPDGFGFQNGWQAWYTVSGANTQLGESPQGDSYHITSLAGAQITLQFYGSAVYLYGTANASYDVTLDNALQSPSPTDGLLYSIDGLMEENHSVTLTAKPSKQAEVVQFGRAVVSTSDQTAPTEIVHDNLNGNISYSGQWITKTVAGIPNSSVTTPFHMTPVQGSSLTMNFSSAVAVALYASTNTGHGLYSISIDNDGPQIYNASTNWLVTNTVIFFQAGLDPRRTHTLNATNMSDGLNFTFSSVVIYQADAAAIPPSSSSAAGSNSTGGPDNSNPEASSHSHAKVGVIVGLIVGVVVLVLVAGFLWLWLRSRKSRRSAGGTISPLILPHSKLGSSSSSMIQTGMLTPTPIQRKDRAPWPRPVAASSPPHTPNTPDHTPTTSGHTPNTPNHTATTPTRTPSTPGFPAVSPTSPANVNQIIELIAQRIDRREGPPSSSSLPPGYRPF